MPDTAWLGAFKGLVRHETIETWEQHMISSIFGRAGESCYAVGAWRSCNRLLGDPWRGVQVGRLAAISQHVEIVTVDRA